MIILGIETTCDETGLALIEFKNKKFRILNHKLRSQYLVHAPYGGIVPILTAREHRKNLPILYRDLIHEINFDEKKIDYLAFAIGPGLPPALLAGKDFVFRLAIKLKKKIIPVNHLIAHFYSVLIKKDYFSLWQELRKIDFPALGLLISGGHTILVYFESLEKYKKIGETIDDAIGESLDKSARILNLEYPGGPKLEKLAKKGKPIFNLPYPLMLTNNFNFSFSGLKTAFWELVEDIKRYNKLDESTKADLAASYQKTAFEILLIKTKKAYEKFKPQSIIISGGVASNQFLRNLFKKYFSNQKIIFPQKSLATDNGIKIAFCGYFFLEKALEARNLDINSNLKI
ncbi:MAG: tRNA (adenosine(37)-N6)-threonylcarbamoyltransferase complex transferase subunit TsaD [Patescibacteria group bacterium]|nr:tRNA (adenosine(37)-N6)-threonylcarbamoyltransferase complex transferase subunit TsaD [Patescibacteria group bacterium]